MQIPQNRLSRGFFCRPTANVARDLLGQWLLRHIDNQWVGGVIVETEAYLSDRDLASHSRRGKTASNAAMFGPAGLAYVYPIHAKYCFNVVTETSGIGCAVLVRAIEPIVGIEKMQAHRGVDEPRRLTRGPAMLCQALAIERGFDGVDLCADQRIGIYASQTPITDQSPTIATRRIGVSKSKDERLRFAIANHPFVSGPKSLASSRPSDSVQR